MATFASAQTTTESATEGFFDLSTGYYFSDNYDALENPTGNTYLWRTDATLGYASETRSEQFSAEAGTTLELGEYGEDDGENGGFLNPFFQVSYDRQGYNANLETELSYRQSENRFDRKFQPQTGRDLIVDQGTRRDLRFAATLAGGNGTPTTSEATLQFRQTRYQDTTDPDLTDRDTLLFNGRLELAATRTAQLFGVLDYYDRDDIEDLKSDEIRKGVGLGINVELNPRLAFYGAARYESNALTQTVGSERVTTERHEPTLDLRLTQDMKNGNLRTRLRSRLESTGVQTDLSFGRALDLIHGSVDLTIGATRTSSGTVTPVGSIDWTRDYKTSALQVVFRSAVRTNDDDEDTVDSRLNVNYAQELTQLTGMELSLGLYSSDPLDDGGENRERADFSASLYREINEDWRIRAGYTHNYAFDRVDELIAENVFFATLDRNFTFRP
ncbi:hypothetical protein [Aliiruegeria haliotis]|uniref:hypothetical protein n=1 Tax=Aliiruegeria haliotis TaxID=1280846 RepID=UPI000D04CDE2|nr:hypothetical protein [Aliiruegeria haliotis]